MQIRYHILEYPSTGLTQRRAVCLSSGKLALTCNSPAAWERTDKQGSQAAGTIFLKNWAQAGRAERDGRTYVLCLWINLENVPHEEEVIKQMQ